MDSSSISSWRTPASSKRKRAIQEGSLLDQQEMVDDLEASTESPPEKKMREAYERSQLADQGAGLLDPTIIAIIRGAGSQEEVARFLRSMNRSQQYFLNDLKGYITTNTKKMMHPDDEVFASFPLFIQNAIKPYVTDRLGYWIVGIESHEHIPNPQSIKKLFPELNEDQVMLMGEIGMRVKKKRLRRNPLSSEQYATFITLPVAVQDRLDSFIRVSVKHDPLLGKDEEVSVSDTVLETESGQETLLEEDDEIIE